MGTLSPNLGTEEEILVTALGLHALSGEGAKGSLHPLGMAFPAQECCGR